MQHIETSHTLLGLYQEVELMKVVLESRFSAPDVRGLVFNKKFTLACMRDCFLRGEAPYASHVIYAQTHILDDFIASERALGMHAGFLWGDLALKTVVYTDLGISTGMQMGIDHAEKMGRLVEYRTLGYFPDVRDEEVELEAKIIENQKKLLQELKSNIHADFNMCLIENTKQSRSA